MPVYFIQAGEDGPVKIGFAADPNRRICNLQTGHHSPLTLRAVMPGTEADEAALHARFDASHIRGEWFDPSDALVSLMARHGVVDPAAEATSGHPLKQWRTSQNLSLDSLAERVRASKSTLSRIETYSADPSVSLIRRICEASGGELTANDFVTQQRAS